MQPIASMKRKREEAVHAILRRNAQIIQALNGVLPAVAFFQIDPVVGHLAIKNMCCSQSFKDSGQTWTPALGRLRWLRKPSKTWFL